MKISRRRFLATLGVAVVAVGAGALWSRRLALRRWVLQTPIPGSAPGPLQDSTAETLLATVRALLGDAVEPGHYLDFFRWRAAHLPGHRRLYAEFEATVDRAARRDGHAGFRDCPRDRQRRILRDMLPAAGLERIRRGLVARNQARFGQEILRPIFRRFANTDAWVMSGYDAWPGMPRAVARLGGEPRIS